MTRFIPAAAFAGEGDAPTPAQFHGRAALDALLDASADFERACDRYQAASARRRSASATAVETALARLDAAAAVALGSGSALPERVRAHAAKHYRTTLLPYIRRTEVARRMLEKPRGYAGDFLTIELIYRNQTDPGGTLGELLDHCILDMAPPRAVRNRRRMMCQEIARSAAEWSSAPLRVTSLACGPARELFDFVAAHGSAGIDATLVDIDQQALDFVQQRAETHGFRPRLQRQNLVKAATAGASQANGDQDLVYSVGLIDYLNDALVVALLDWIHAQLRPGRRVIVGNFHPRNPSRVLMDEVLDWKLVHRTEADLDRLLAASRFGRSSTAMRCEPTGINLFASCTRD